MNQIKDFTEALMSTMETLDSSRDVDGNIADLCINLASVFDQLQEGSKRFAFDLIDKAIKKNYVSEKQEYWMVKLYEDIVNPKEEIKETASAGTLELFQFFHNALEHVKYPKVKFELSGGYTIQIHLAGKNSKYNGQLLVTDGKFYPNNEYYGRINTAGKWLKSNICYDTVHEFVLRLLENPKETMADYGIKSGNCCFCNKPLINEDSLHVGYGPVCAKKFGLPYGG
jgi:hypothetical protein